MMRNAAPPFTLEDLGNIIITVFALIFVGWVFGQVFG
jgi:hypothetical protein